MYLYNLLDQLKENLDQKGCLDSNMDASIEVLKNGTYSLENPWIHTSKIPLTRKDKQGNKHPTIDALREYGFLAAKPHYKQKKPVKMVWWVRHCKINDKGELMLYTGESTDVNTEEVKYWLPAPKFPGYGD